MVACEAIQTIFKGTSKNPSRHAELVSASPLKNMFNNIFLYLVNIKIILSFAPEIFNEKGFFRKWKFFQDNS